MSRVELINYKGKEIVYLDFSDAKLELILETIYEAKQIIKKQPTHSVLTLTNVTGLVFNRDIVEAFKELTIHNKPYIHAGAVLGIKGLQKIAYDVVMTFSNRNLPVFEDRITAMDWLITQ